MPKFHFPSRHVPANGVVARRVPSQLAPERCIGYEHGVAGQSVVIVGSDLDGHVRIKVEVAREDVSSWLVKVIRHWLAWYYGASEIKIVS
jgi:hypothetical protein